MQASIVGGPLYGTQLVFAGRPPAPIDENRRAARVARVVDGLKQAASYAGEHAVTLAVEPLNRFETDFCNTARQAVELVELVDRSLSKSTANRIAGNITRGDGFGLRASLLGEYMIAPTYFVGNPDYTGFLLHHRVHAMDLAPWLMKEDATSVHARKFEMEPGKLLLHVGFHFASGALAAVAMGTCQSRGTPMEWWQVMGDHQRVEVRNVHEVRHFRHPPFKAADPLATLDPAVDTLVWEPNFTAAANEDHKGYHGLLAAFLRAINGEANDAPDIADGVKAMKVLEAVVRSMASGKIEAM